MIDGNDWTYVSEVTEYNVLGEELENKDALGRFSSASFGYNQSMAISVAANSQYQEQGFDGFEDYAYSVCADNHFKYAGETPDNTQSHTGKFSLKVPNGTTKTMTKQLEAGCTPLGGCTLAINVDHSSSSYSVTFTGAADPVSVSWNIISGTPSIVPSSGGFTVNGSGFQVQITVTDSNG